MVTYNLYNRGRYPKQRWRGLNDGESELILALAQLGLTSNEGKAYLSLLAFPGTNAYEVSRRSGMPSSKVYGVLTKLVDKGLALPVGSDPVRYEPLPAKEFIRRKNAEFMRLTSSLESRLPRLSLYEQPQLLWHVRGYDNLIDKASELISSAKESSLVSMWENQGRELGRLFQEVAERGVKLTSLQFGRRFLELGQVYVHSVFPTVSERHGSEFFLVVDDDCGLMMYQIPGRDWEGYWTTNVGIVRVINNYIRHDIYLTKILSRFGPLIRQDFGEELERLLDIAKDEL